MPLDAVEVRLLESLGVLERTGCMIPGSNPFIREEDVHLALRYLGTLTKVLNRLLNR